MQIADVYPNISEAKEPLPNADEWKNIKEKNIFLIIKLLKSQHQE